VATTYDCYIGGRFRPEVAAERFPVINPTTEEVIAEVPEADAAAVDEAVAAAAVAQEAWARLAPIERASYLRRLAARLREHVEPLAELLTAEQGKVLDLARAEVRATADYLDFTAEWARRIEGEVLPSDRRGENIFLLRLPIGVVAGILPWNYPLFLLGRKLAPALLAGNTVVLKTAEETPLNGFYVAELVDQVGFPPGVVNILSGHGPTTGRALAGHPGVGLVTFTGSVETGRAILRAAAENITKVSLELGGKAPAIVMDDADLALAAEKITVSRVHNSGQVCNCAERVLVHERVYEPFLARLTEAMRAVRFGDPRQPGMDMGPLVSRERQHAVKALVDQAVGEGAELRLGGGFGPYPKGYFFEPTILTGCRQDMAVVQREVFGPVLPVQTFRDLDEAIALANDSEYGLTSSIFTESLEVALRAMNELKFGETYVNREHSEAMQAFHSGWRHSGIGGADGRHGLEEFLQKRVVYIQRRGDGR